jgi:hypothetical protein
MVRELTDERPVFLSTLPAGLEPACVESFTSTDHLVPIDTIFRRRKAI